ncbi:MAG: sulfotransferase [Methylophaga sp.]
MSTKHIHIVGCLPRSGTTLMTELMISCFDIDGYTDHECSIFREFTDAYSVLCTKNPNDIARIRYPLKVNPNLYVIYMLRDPRDAIASRSHRNNRANKKIWGSLGGWLAHHEYAASLKNNPRFITIRYEDLVTRPDETQQYLLRQLPFLRQKHRFSEYHLVAKPSEKSAAALGGARPITPVSVGNWRKQKSFLKAQVEKYGAIDELLIELGYESDQQWLRELDEVVSDNTSEPQRKKSSFRRFKDRFFTQPRRKLLYRLSTDKFIGNFVRRLRSKLRALDS